MSAAHEGECAKCGGVVRLPPALQQTADAIHANPGSTTAEIAKAMGMEHRAALRRLERMWALNAVSQTGCGNASCQLRWWPLGLELD